MTDILSCGHPQKNGYWLVEYVEMVNNLDGGDGDPPLVSATVTACWCAECRETGEFISAEWIGDTPNDTPPLIKFLSNPD